MQTTPRSTAALDPSPLPRLGPSAVPLWRGPGILQFGTGPGAVVAAGVPERLIDAVTLLDGRHPRSALVVAIGEEWSEWLVGLVTSEGLAVADVPPTRTAVVGDGLLADAVRSAITDAGDDVAPSWTSDTDVVVVATDRGCPGPGITDRLLRRDRRHLVAGLEAGGAVVGPLVRPGVTACCRCLDLHRHALDPSWPLIAAQVARWPMQVSGAVLAWTAATVAITVRNLGTGSPAAAGDSTLHLGSDGVLSSHAWTPHPRCGCGAAGGGRPRRGPE